MAQLKHCAHQCVLTSPKIKDYGICDLCHEDRPVEYSCDRCNFDLCQYCSKLPLVVSQDFHRHPLEFSEATDDDKARHMLCSRCGELFRGSRYYKCNKCEIYLHLGCALPENIETGWDEQEMFHYSHAHSLRRCKPGLDAEGSCLMCELPITPSAICYGCVPCFSFVHERCLNLPREIHHPVHPKHPLIRLDFTQNCGRGKRCGKRCEACGKQIESVPLGCPKCDFSLHFRCADSVLRGLMHKHHHHKLFYVASNKGLVYPFSRSCGSCGGIFSYGKPCYHCVECDWRIHVKCLGLPDPVVKKSYHIHPLVCKRFSPEDEDDSLEYCGVCETVVHPRHLAYCCKKCDFVGHIECILREGEAPSPLYLKDLYSRGENVTKELENKLVVSGIGHDHVLKYYDDPKQKYSSCKICRGTVHSTLWKCEICTFSAHDSCVKLGQESNYRLHQADHPLTLLPGYPAGIIMKCHTCGNIITSFNLFCRRCDFIVCSECAVRAINNFLVELKRGQKFVRRRENIRCLTNKHTLVQVKVSRSYSVACIICNDRLCGNALTCTECEDIYHPRCIELWKSLLGPQSEKISNHLIHYDHDLDPKLESGSKCTACKMNITKCGYVCGICPIRFHFKCLEVVGISRKIEPHKHYLYNFLRDDSLLPPRCTVCNKWCDASFYGCNCCNFNAHIECTGFPKYVKNQRHQHPVVLEHSRTSALEICSLCGLGMQSLVHGFYYSCSHCKDKFHAECIMSMEVEREAATADEQISDIYLMYIELDLYNKIGFGFTESLSGSSKTDTDEEDGDEEDSDEEDADGTWMISTDSDE